MKNTLTLILLVVTLLAMNGHAQSEAISFVERLDAAYYSHEVEWLPDKKGFLIPGKVNGQDAKFYIDSGAKGSILTLAVAKRLGMKTVDLGGKFGGVAGQGKMYGTIADSLQIGEHFTLNHQKMPVLEMQNFDWADGLFGANHLVSSEGVIDYEKRRFLFPRKEKSLDLAELSEKAGLEVLNLEREGNYCFVTLNYGDERVRFFVDTGAQASILRTMCAERLKLELAPSSVKIRGGGGGAMPTESAQLDGMRAAATVIESFGVLVTPFDSLAGYSKKPVDGILGADFLSAAGAYLGMKQSVLIISTDKIAVNKKGSDEDAEDEGQ